MAVTTEVPRNTGTPPHERRFRWVALGVVVAVVALVVAHHWWSQRQTRDVPVPSASASPGTVVQAFLEATAAHDCVTQSVLWPTPGEDPAEASGCGGGGHIDHPRVLRVSTSGPDEAYVFVSFENHPNILGDGSGWEAGQVDWGYYVHRRHGAWRIYDAGVG